MNTRIFLQDRIKALGRIIRKRVQVLSPDYYHLHRNTRPDPHSKSMQDELFLYLAAQPLNKYPDLTSLYKKLSVWLDIPVDHLLLTQGADDAIRTVFSALSRPGGAIACLDPSYKMYSIYAEAFDTPLRPITPTLQDGKFSADIKDILKAFAEGVDLFFMPNPNEPVETYFTQDEVSFIIGEADRHGVIVIVDEAYAKFGAESISKLVTQFPNLIVIQSFSKWFGLPAIRLGYIIANSDLTRALHALRPAYETNGLSMATALWALDNLNYFDDYASEVIETRDWLHTQLSEIGLTSYGEYSNAIAISLSSPDEAKQIVLKLRSKGILVRNSLPSPAEHCIGVTIGSRESMERFLTLFKESLER